jgi:glycosyltransferase involved in cell wall biosynthesis
MVWNVARAFFTGIPLQAGFFYRRGIHAEFRRVIRDIGPDHIYCQLLRVAPYMNDHDALLPSTLDYQDVFSMGIKRRITTSPWYMRPVLRMEYRRLLAYERKLFDCFDNKTIISLPDREQIDHPAKEQIHVIPNGVDGEFFVPVEREKSYDVVFTGNMGYPPNVNAAEYLAGEIFPLVLKRKPGARLLLAGATPHPKVQALKNKNVTVSGWVSDIRESYASARIFIAPMRIGTGLQNKLLEAMSMELPCITSPLANAGLGAEPGAEIMIGKNAEEYAGHILFLLDNPGQARQLAFRGRQFVNKSFSWEGTTKMLNNVMTSSGISR